MSLAGCVALITGAARNDGIGQGIARDMLEKGVSGLLFTDIDERRGAETCGGLVAEFGADRIGFLRHDVTSESDWGAALDTILTRFGQLDILVNNAGASLPSSIATTSLADLRRGMAINFESQFIGIKTCAPALARRSSGRTGGSAIVNNSSMAAYLADPTNLAYHLSKAAVRMLTMCAAKELGPQGIRVNSVHYGPILTAPMRQALHGYAERGQFADDAAALAGIAAMSPLGITGTIQEAGALVTFLVSDDARFVTGAAFWQDGGCFSQY